MIIEPWMFWSLISAPFISGFGVGVWVTQMVSKKACKAYRNELKCDLTDERKAIWLKIDKIYDKVMTA